ncbi:MAG: hypothetical protein U1F15_03810 [Burkholderiales bacterium]
MRTFLARTLLALAAAAAPLAYAQDATQVAALEALQKAAKADKRALVASTLKLTDAEAKKFWPVYDQFQRDLEPIVRQRNRALEGLAMRDKPMTDAYAKSLVTELASLDEQEAKTRRKMANAAMRALPPKKAALYMQLESKLRAAQNYEIAAVFPLAQ